MDSQNGYAGQILRVDLSTGDITMDATALYADRFLGGRGVALKIYWDEVAPASDAFDPDNRLLFMTGPICGVPGLAGSRWQVCGKSPWHNRFSYANLGGAWGAQLKFAGYDGLVVSGCADRLTYLHIDDGRVELKDAGHLKGRGAIETRELLKSELGPSFRIAAIGAAGENRVYFANLLADSDSSGASGFGAVMGAKNLKAIAVRGGHRVAAFDEAAVAALRTKLRKFKFTPFTWPTIMPAERISRDVCYGCINGCMRVNYRPTQGSKGKYFCQSGVFYEIRAQRYYGKVTDVPFQATKLCDDHGIDTRAIETMMMWLSRCQKANILTEASTGLPLSQMGSYEFIETLLRRIAFREGFGDVLAHGTHKAAQIIGQGSDQLITDYMIKTGEDGPYRPRYLITTGLLYATEPRMPIQQLHEVGLPVLLWASREVGLADMLMKGNYMTSEVLRGIAKKFWGGEIAADFSTYAGKAQAAVHIQNRQYAKESLILCDFSWPINHSPISPDHVGDPALESRVCRAVTGRDLGEQRLYHVAERVFNLQRAVLAREGHLGRAADTLEEFNFTVPLKAEFGNPECLIPGRDGQAFSRKGMVLDRDEFEKMKDEYYAIRGWQTASGKQTRAGLAELGLADTAETLGREGLLAE